MSRVISCSRRTDIPAFYSEWFINRIRAGYCYVLNPFSSHIYYVSLKPEDCIAIVFWTRNPVPLMKYLSEIKEEGFKFYFQYSILGYPKVIESHNPPVETAISNFKRLVEQLTPDQVRWRYDPIVISTLTPIDYHLTQFEKIAQSLAGYTNHCVFSFVDYYGKTKNNFQKITDKTDLKFENCSLDDQRELSLKLLKIAQTNNMILNSCCDDDLAIGGIRKNHCIDLGLLRKITRNSLLNLKNEPTRDDCGCVSSVDIGSYDTCLFGCTYCYATRNRTQALLKSSKHDPSDSILVRPAKYKDVNLAEVATHLKNK